MPEIAAVTSKPSCFVTGGNWVRNNPLLVTAICLAIIGGITGVVYSTDFTFVSKIIVGAVAGAFAITIPLLLLSQAAPQEQLKGTTSFMPVQFKEIVRTVFMPKESAELKRKKEAIKRLCNDTHLAVPEEAEATGALDTFLKTCSFKTVMVVKDNSAILCLRVKEKNSTDNPFYIQITPVGGDFTVSVANLTNNRQDLNASLSALARGHHTQYQLV